MVSQNPVLHNITDYLIEEASAEEEELLGQAAETEDNEVKDQTLLKVCSFSQMPWNNTLLVFQISCKQILYEF